LSYTYDGLLLKSTTWAGTIAGLVSRNYDNNFRITSQSVNGGNSITFGYDNDGLLTSAGSLIISRNNQNGLITGTTLGTVTDTRGYSTFRELNTYTASVSGNAVFSTTFTRDKMSRITQKIETIQGITDTYDYTYDPAGRLQEVKKNGVIQAIYGYDSNGNRLTYTSPTTGTINGTYDAQDRLTSYGQLQFTYNHNGELLTKSNPTLGQSATYTYDVFGNLKNVQLPGGTDIEYVTDGQQRRIGKKVGGTLMQGFLYQNQLNPVAELDGGGGIVSRFVYGSKPNVPDYMIKAGVTYRIVSDHLGSPRLVINSATGAIAQKVDYDEFGNITNDTAPGFQPFGFAGGLYDQQTGLTRFGVRDYDAQIGRWTAKDPIGFYGRSLNLYGYLSDDPVNFIDPSGLCPYRCKPATLHGKVPHPHMGYDPLDVTAIPVSPEDDDGLYQFDVQIKRKQKANQPLKGTVSVEPPTGPSSDPVPWSIGRGQSSTQKRVSGDIGDTLIVILDPIPFPPGTPRQPGTDPNIASGGEFRGVIKCEK
jgi:RHS repeat-associated protein